MLDFMKAVLREMRPSKKTPCSHNLSTYVTMADLNVAFVWWLSRKWRRWSFRPHQVYVSFAGLSNFANCLCIVRKRGRKHAHEQWTSRKTYSPTKRTRRPKRKKTKHAHCLERCVAPMSRSVIWFLYLPPFLFRICFYSEQTLAANKRFIL